MCPGARQSKLHFGKKKKKTLLEILLQRYKKPMMQKQFVWNKIIIVEVV